MTSDNVGDVQRELIRVVCLLVIAVDTAQGGITTGVDIGEFQSARVQLLELIDEVGRKAQ